MLKAKTKSFGYYFLNKRLHPPFPEGYRVSIILLIINKNQTENKNKFLVVQQVSKLWGLPKEGIKSKITVEDIYTTIARNLELELGFKGIKVIETKPLFKQVGLLYDFDKQEYDPVRAKQEAAKGRPTKGKIYLLSMMEYRGPDKIPVSQNPEVLDYKWIDQKAWPDFQRLNLNVSKQEGRSDKTAAFADHLLNKSMKAYQAFEQVMLLELGKEDTLF